VGASDAPREETDAGRLPPGSRVPGENELMSTYGVEQPTARSALDLLKNEGLIVARRGAGTFVREFRLYRRRSPARLGSSGWGTGRSIRQSDDAERQAGTRITETDSGAGGVYALLAELGHQPVNFREELRARMPRDSETKLLEIAQGTPVIEVAPPAGSGG
jgi:GntR family transcriptional regulator